MSLDADCRRTTSTQTLNCEGLSCRNEYTGGCDFSAEYAQSTTQTGCVVPDGATVIATICRYDDVCCPIAVDDDGNVQIGPIDGGGDGQIQQIGGGGDGQQQPIDNGGGETIQIGEGRIDQRENAQDKWNNDPWGWNDAAAAALSPSSSLPGGDSDDTGRSVVGVAFAFAVSALAAAYFVTSRRQFLRILRGGGGAVGGSSGMMRSGAVRGEIDREDGGGDDDGDGDGDSVHREIDDDDDDDSPFGGGGGGIQMPARVGWKKKKKKKKREKRAGTAGGRERTIYDDDDDDDDSFV